MISNFAKKTYNHISRSFSTAQHSPIVIIGAGTAGVRLAAELSKSGFKQNEIRIIDPSTAHYYQPGFTMVGGGIYSPTQVVKDTRTLLRKNCYWHKGAVASIEPQQNQVTTTDGSVFSYDQLIVAAGIENNYDAVKGLKEAFDNPNAPVSTIYNYNYAQKWTKIMREYRGKKAVFTQPTPPIKCPGAPQKILHLSHDLWGSKTNYAFYTAMPSMFAVPKYNKILTDIATSKNFDLKYEHNLKEVRVADKVAVFTNLKDKTDVEVPFDILHAVAPQRPPQFLRDNKSITLPTGFVDVDPGTLQSNKFKNIWALGDCAGTTNSKTAAAIYSQVPVITHNILQAMKKRNEVGFNKYQGYASCPLFVGEGKVLLAEFKYGGVLDESFGFLSNKPRPLFYKLKTELFPYAYWNWAPRGWWYGRDGLGFV